MQGAVGPDGPLGAVESESVGSEMVPSGTGSGRVSSEMWIVILPLELMPMSLLPRSTEPDNWALDFLSGDSVCGADDAVTGKQTRAASKNSRIYDMVTSWKCVTPAGLLYKQNLCRKLLFRKNNINSCFYIICIIL